MGVARLQGNDLVAGDAHQHDEQRERPGIGELGREPLLEVGLHPRTRRPASAACSARTPAGRAAPRSASYQASKARNAAIGSAIGGASASLVIGRSADAPRHAAPRRSAAASRAAAGRPRPARPGRLRSSRSRGTAPRAAARPRPSRSGSRAAMRAMSPSALSRRQAKARARSASLSWASTFGPHGTLGRLGGRAIGLQTGDQGIGGRRHDGPN